MIYYTDGACSSKDNCGGWSCICVDGPTFYGYEEDTTNNRMELLGVITALQHFSSQKEIGATVYTDSAYISNCFKDKWYMNWQKNGWKNASKQPVKNRDLWEQLIGLYEGLKSRMVIIAKVKGHDGDTYNEMCDKLAVKARKEKIENKYE